MNAGKNICAVLLLIFCASLAPSVRAQSLADLAREEREKKGQPSATPKVYTNKDLHGTTPDATPNPNATASTGPNGTEKHPKPPSDIKGDTFALYALQTLTASLYPGSKAVGDDKLALADGTQKTVQILALTGHKVPTGWLYIAGVEFEEDQTAALQAMLTLKPAPAAVTHLFAFYLDPTGNLRSSKKGVLDSRVVATQLDEFHFPAAPQNGSWPKIQAIAWHWYGSPKWTGRVRFVSKIDTAKMAVVERLPVALSKKPNHADSTDDALSVEPIDNKTILIKASIADRSLRYPCTTPCIVDGEHLLDSW